MYWNELSGRIVASANNYNFSDSERWTFDSNDTVHVQMVCYNERGEPQSCQPDHMELFQTLLAVVCSLSIVGDCFVISLCIYFEPFVNLFMCY